MNSIAEALVEETWREVGALSETQARRQMDQLARSQPSLLAFVLGATGGLRTDAQQVAVYLYAVIHRMFEKTAGRLTPATPQEISSAYQRNHALLGRGEHIRARLREAATEHAASSQPFVMKYLAEALTEAPEGDNPLVLSEEETDTLFLVLKSVVDILDGVAPRSDK